VSDPTKFTISAAEKRSLEVSENIGNADFICRKINREA